MAWNGVESKTRTYKAVPKQMGKGFNDGDGDGDGDDNNGNNDLHIVHYMH